MSAASHRRKAGFVAALAFVSGASTVIGRVARKAAESSDFSISLERAVTSILVGAVLTAALATSWRWLFLRVIDRLPLPTNTRARFNRFEWIAFLPLVTPLLGIAGLRISTHLVAIVLAAVVLSQLAVLIWALETGDDERVPIAIRWISLLFMSSGFCALIYQVAWQRVLFGAFGVNIESVTLIVSIFMFGLGVGSIFGGRISVRHRSRLLAMFIACEALIGAFGLVSIPLIEWTSARTMQLPLPGISLAIYALLSLPTLLMGASLPILATWLNRQFAHVGTSVGTLYWVNTIGAAIACFVTVDVLFRIGGLSASVMIAALVNLSVAAGGYLLVRTLSHREGVAV